MDQQARNVILNSCTAPYFEMVEEIKSKEERYL